MNNKDTYYSQILQDFFGNTNQKEYSKVEKNMLLAALIDKAMKNKGYKKKEFAALMEVQPAAVSRWLSGNHNFTLNTLYEIERVLSIKLINLNTLG